MPYPKAASFLVCLLCAIGAFWASYVYFKSQELEKAAARLTLYRGTVEAELGHFSHLPFLLSEDPVVIDTLMGGDRTRLNKRLARFAQSAGIDAIYVMDHSGLTISASNARAPNSFVGQNYGFRPYFQAALRGELGEFYGVGVTTGKPGYFLAMAVRPEATHTLGVVAIKVDLSVMQDTWQSSGERIVLSNSDGVVILASDPAWRYRTLTQLAPPQRARILQDQQFANAPLTPLDWRPNLAGQTATLHGERYLYLHTADLPNAWSLHFFAPDDQAIARAGLTTGFLIMLGGLAFIFYQVRHVREIANALVRSEHNEAELRLANDRLAVEIEVRRAAEKSLKKTQSDLERAGRLAALGQLASSVTHELGQPIAAMRNQLTAWELRTGETSLTTKMQGLVARMEDITRQLKFFSRKGRDQFEQVDLAQVIQAALEMLDPTINAAEADVRVTEDAHAITMIGNKMRLEQVATNLVRNALDAVEGGPQRRIDIRLGRTDTEVWFEVADTGHGLGGRTMEDLREPFATTRESGKGMGLGLTISAGIVADHGGTLTARERTARGAVFRAVFPTSEKDPAA